MNTTVGKELLSILTGSSSLLCGGANYKLRIETLSPDPISLLSCLENKTI